MSEEGLDSNELHELLAAWLGGEISKERRVALLARLRRDEEFREAFVTEVRTFAMLQAVQSPEPRWLRLQDELGLAGANESEAFESRVRVGLRSRPRPFVAAWWRPLAASAAAVAVIFAVLFFRRGPELPLPTGGDVAGSRERLAVAVRLDDVRWDGAQEHPLLAGGSVAAGPLRISAGRLTLAYFSGVSVHVEGPADLVLVGPDRILCRRGNLRAKIVEGAEGFTIETPGAAIVDLGTEFGVKVETNGRAQVVVYQGKAEASLLAPDGSPRRTQTLSAAQSVELDPGSGTMRSISPRELLAAPALDIAPLRLASDYPQRILAAKPRHYWRGTDAEGGRLRDLVTGSASLRVAGPVQTMSDGSLRFTDSEEPQYLRADGEWMPPDEFAIELWFASAAFHNSVLAVLQSAPPGRGDLVMAELTRRNPATPLRPGRVRFLYRWPPGGTDGVNLYSAPLYIPYRWQHLVCQRCGSMLEMYLDGQSVGETSLQGMEQTIASTLRFGRLNEDALSGNARQFQGRLAELAVYERALAVEEIRGHAGLD
jgi:hypothetical protein